MLSFTSRRWSGLQDGVVAFSILLVLSFLAVVWCNQPVYILRERIDKDTRLVVKDTRRRTDSGNEVVVTTYPWFYIGTIPAQTINISSLSIFDRLLRVDDPASGVTCVYDESQEFVFVYSSQKKEEWILASDAAVGSNGSKRSVGEAIFLKTMSNSKLVPYRIK